MTNLNPYAVPEATLDPTQSEADSSLDRASLGEAIRQLNEHLSDPQNVARDQRMDDGYLPTSTAIALGILAASIAGMIGAGIATDGVGGWLAFSSPLIIATIIIILVVLARAITIGPRSRAISPKIACTQHYRAMLAGRLGTIISGLSPTARSQAVKPPNIPPVETGGGIFQWTTRQTAKQFLKTFARTGSGQIRWVKFKKIISVEIDEQNPAIAICRLRIRFRTWPQWANYVSVAVFVVLSFVGLILALVLYYALRKNRAVTFDKTFIQGRDGLWYAATGDPIERIVQ